MRLIDPDLKRIAALARVEGELPVHCIPGREWLNPVQNQALAAAMFSDRCVGLIGVGWGKSLLAMILPTIFNSARPLYLTEAGIMPAFRAEMEKWWPKLKEMNAHTCPLHLETYERLSQPQCRNLLEEIRPDYIFCDEVHNLGNPEATRTKRIMEYMHAYPDTKFVPASGTITSRSVHNYEHILEMALGDKTPLPTDPRILEALAKCTDAWDAALRASPPTGADWGYMWALAQAWGVPAFDWSKGTEEMKREWARAMLRDRLKDTPGIVMTTESSFQGGLVIRPRSCEITAPIKAALKEASQIDDPLERAKVERELGQGFRYEWDWPDGVPDKEWLQARRRYNRAIEDVMENFPNADSPAMAEKTLMHIPGGEFLHLARDVIYWNSIKHLQPPTKTVWIDPGLMPLVVLRWACVVPAELPGLVWYSDNATRQVLAANGWDTYGPGDGEPPAEPGRIIALSIDVYGTGWNLQRYNYQLILNASSSGKVWEQLLGRTHRQGQAADTVYVDVMQHLPRYRSSLKQAREDAQYIEQTTGQRQKLNMATYIPFKKEN